MTDDPQAQRIHEVREKILADIRAAAPVAYDRMQAASMQDSANIARTFLAVVCGHFDYLAKVEGGEL